MTQVASYATVARGVTLGSGLASEADVGLANADESPLKTNPPLIPPNRAKSGKRSLFVTVINVAVTAA